MSQKNDSHEGAGVSRIWAGLASRTHTIDGLRQSGIGSEHGQTMIRVLKIVFEPRLRELARQVVLLVHSK